MNTIELPEPRKSGGKPLLDVLAKRETVREMKPDALSLQLLSDIVWAAFGINRPEIGKRTAPSARNAQEIDVYVALPEGLYLYRPDKNVLESVLEKDVRAASGRQDWVGTTPVNLIYVADDERMKDFADSEKVHLAAADAAFIAENVCLFCTSEDLAAVVRNDVDKAGLAKEMGLGSDKRVVLAQSVGYPA